MKSKKHFRVKKLSAALLSILLTVAMLSTTVPVSAAEPNEAQSKTTQTSDVTLVNLSADEMPKQRDETQRDAQDESGQKTIQGSSLRITKQNCRSTGATTFTYETVTGEIREYTLPEKYVAHISVEPKEGNKIDGKEAAGFSVIDMCFEVTDSETGQTTFFYPIEIKNFEYDISMELTDGSKFNDPVYVCKNGTDEWAFASQDEYTVTSAGTVKVRVKQPGVSYVACYLAKSDASSAVGKALLTYSYNTDLGDSPKEDCEALKETLGRTDNFSRDNVEIAGLDFTAGDTKEKFKQKLDTMFKDNTDESISLVYYSGHGSCAVDGSSSMAISESVYLPAKEFKSWLSEYKGKFIVLFDCCFSGGMFYGLRRPADGQSEGNVAQTQDDADKVAQQFANELSENNTANTGGASAGTGYEYRYNIFAAASRVEYSWQSSYLGGQLTVSFCHGLGYDRCETAYDNYAADYDGNHEITMKEMAKFFKKQAMDSSPVMYPENSDEVLFKYSGGTSALFDADFKIKQVTLRETDDSNFYEMTVSADIRNLSDTDRKFNACVFSEDYRAALEYPGGVDDLGEARTDTEEYVRLYENKPIEIKANAEGTLTLTGKVSKDKVKDSDLMYLRIWCEDDNKNFISPYENYIFGVKTENNDNESISRDALQIKSPYQVESPQEATLVSESLPITVVFDTEHTNKTGYAGCRLTLKAYKVDDDGNKSADDKGTVIYEDVQPIYSHYEMSSDKKYSSTYEYVWDMREDGQALSDGIYKLELTCKYLDGTEGETKTVSTYVNKTADPGIKTINEMTFPMNGYERRSGCDILLGDTQTNGEIVQSTFGSNLEYMKLFFSSMTKKLNPGGEPFNVQVCWLDNDIYEIPSSNPLTCGDYILEVVLEIPENIRSEVKFAPHCLISCDDYEVLYAAISDDGYAAGFYITCHVPEYNESDIVITDESGNVITGDLKAGSKIKVSTKSYNPNLKAEVYDGALGPDADGVYTIYQYTDKLGILLKNKDEKYSNTAYLKFYDVKSSYAEGDLEGYNLTKTAYIAGESDTLDLSGTVLYIHGKDPVEITKDMLENWDDKYLKIPGLYPITVNYNGERYEDLLKICVVSKNDGTNLKIDEGVQFVYNYDGVVKYVDSGDNYTNIVLLPVYQAEVNDDKSGTLHVKTVFALKEEINAMNPARIYIQNNNKGFSYLIPYPEGIGSDYDFEVEDSSEQGGQVTIEKQENGLLIHTKHEGTLQIGYKKASSEEGENPGSGGNQGNSGDSEDPDNNDNPGGNKDPGNNGKPDNPADPLAFMVINKATVGLIYADDAYATANEVQIKKLKEVLDKVKNVTDEAKQKQIWEETIKSITGKDVVIGGALGSLDISLPDGVALPDGGADITFVAKGIKKGENVMVLHLKSDGTWEEIEVKAVEEGQITGHFNSLSPVFYLGGVKSDSKNLDSKNLDSENVSLNEEVSLQKDSSVNGTEITESTPKTGDTTSMFTIVMLMALAGMSLAVIYILNRSRTKQPKLQS